MANKNYLNISQRTPTVKFLILYVILFFLFFGQRNRIDSIYLVLGLDQDDDGFILYESRAICYYIASKYLDQGTSLLPIGVQANALYQQAVFVELSHFHQHGFLAVKEILARQWVLPYYKLNQRTSAHICFLSIRRQGLTPDKEAYEKHIADLSGKLDVYDQILSKQKYLAGNVREFLPADI